MSSRWIVMGLRSHDNKYWKRILRRANPQHPRLFAEQPQHQYLGIFGILSPRLSRNCYWKHLARESIWPPQNLFPSQLSSMNALVSCIVVPENLGCFASLLGESVIGALDLTGNLKIACLSFRLLEVHDNLAEICERCWGSDPCVITCISVLCQVTRVISRIVSKMHRSVKESFSRWFDKTFLSTATSEVKPVTITKRLAAKSSKIQESHGQVSSRPAIYRFKKSVLTVMRKKNYFTW